MFRSLFVSVALSFVLCVSSAIYAQEGFIAAATPEATEAGVSIFQKGGNAVDAAVAIAFALGVTEPAMSGMGGRTMVLLAVPGQEPVAIGGHSLTPSFVESDITKDQLLFHKQVTIPSQVKVLHYTWQKYGSGNLSWADLLAPAITYAKEGFSVGLHRHHVFKRCEEKIKASPHHNQELLVHGEIPAVGDIIKQPTLANTLTRLATAGADDFYKGQIARDIAKDFAENGGWITYKDLANFPEPKEQKAIKTTYRSHDVYSFVPPSGGWQVLQVLNLLEQNNPSIMGKNSFERTVKVAKALNLSHNNRLDNAITDYANFEKEVAHKISKDYAQQLLKSDRASSLGKKPGTDPKEGETTHFSVVDQEGTAVSVTSSIGAYFGSWTSTKTLGFFYNSYVKSLLGFGLGKSLEPNSLVPSSMSPSLVRKNGKNVLVIGTPGSKRIVSTIAQLIQYWVDSNERITKIIQMPRVHAIQNKVYLEDAALGAEHLKQLRETGYKIAFPNYDLTKDGVNAYFGGVHAIGFKNGNWEAAADPRRDGTTN